MPVEIKNLNKSFGNKKVLQNLNMRLKDGGIYCLMGPSGMGKTTLLRIIMNLETKDSGEILGLDPARDIAAMFQEDRILPMLTAIENVQMVYEKKPTVWEVSADLAEILPKKCLRQPASELSGGMKRRVSLAKTMHYGGKMVILDEPFTGLDMETRRQVIRYVLKNRRGRILLVATHGEDDARLLGAEVIRLEKCQDIPEYVSFQGNADSAAREMEMHKVQLLLNKADIRHLKLFLTMASELMESEMGGMGALPMLSAERSPRGILEGIPREKWDTVREMLGGWEQDYKKDEMLWDAGEHVRSLPVILRGAVTAYVLDKKGEEVKFAAFSEGHCFAELLVIKGTPSPVRVCADEDTRVMYLPLEALGGRDTQSPEGLRSLLAWNLAGEMSDKLEIMTKKSFSLTKEDVRTQLLNYLRQLPEGEDGWRALPILQKDLARHLRVSPEHLSKTMIRMEREGVLVRGDRKVKLSKPQEER